MLSFEEIEDCFPDGAVSLPDGWTGVTAQWLHDFAHAVAAKEREACTACVPSNWCDPLLTGPDAVVGKAVACQDIEAVLLAVKKRIESRSNAKVSGAGTASAGLPGWQANGETE